MENNIDRDIFNNAKYIIYYFNLKGKIVTNLMLEKLLYFLEAIYMVKTNDEKLFEEEFYAWNFGPVNEMIYKKYKKYGSMPIKVEPVTIPETNQKIVDYLFQLLGDYNAFDLVGLAHSDDSPWDMINKTYKGNIPNWIIIDKKETKIWFDSIIVIKDQNKENE